MSFGRALHLPMIVLREWSCVGSTSSHTPACSGRGLIPCMAMAMSPDDIPFIGRYEAKHSGFRLSLKVEIVMKTGTTSQSSASTMVGKSWRKAGMKRFRVSRNSRVANSICTMMMHEYMVQSKPKLESCRQDSICIMMMHEYMVQSMPKLESCRLDSICIMMMHEYTVYMLIH